MLPPKSAFTTPVLSTAAPTPELASRRMSSNSGPVIEYVRGPMRIAMAPVASANPNDAGVARQRRGKKQRRWERGGFRSEGRPDRYDSRSGGPRPDGPRPDGSRPDGPRPQPWQAQGDGGNGVSGGERRRRRRRRRRRLDSAPPGQAAFHPGQPGGNGSAAGADAPVSFFAPAGGGSGPIVLGADGLPLRKRRRRRRRGRGGRQREWRTQGPGGDGGDSGGGGPPPSGGSVSDSGDGNG